MEGEAAHGIMLISQQADFNLVRDFSEIYLLGNQRPGGIKRPTHGGEGEEKIFIYLRLKNLFFYFHNKATTECHAMIT